jgi:phenylalanine-4-hydroxylase
MKYNMQQQYELYTPEDQQVWQLLYDRQSEVLPERAASAFLNGMETMHFTGSQIPDFKHVNQVLANTTGWQIEVVPGLIPDNHFFELLSDKRFPSSTWLRKMNQLDYLQEPDMFHDCFAHMPLLTVQFFVDYLQALSKLALRYYHHPLAIEVIGRLYWFTVEFGLIQESAGLRIYGAGILSSAAESIFCLGKDAVHKPLQVGEMMNLPYYKDHFQDRYYIIQDYKELFDALPEIEKRLEAVVSTYSSDIQNVHLVQLNV